MEFTKDTGLYGYEVKKEGGENVLYINYMGAPYVPRLEDSAEVMSRTMDNLMENPNVSRIVFVQQKNYNYDNKETRMLFEISQLYVYLIKQEEVLSQRRLVASDQKTFAERYNKIFSFLTLLKEDPIAAYIDIKNMIIEEKVRSESLYGRQKSEQRGFINLLEKIEEYLEDTELMKTIRPYLDDYSKGDREIYNKVFRADIIPNFTFTRLVSDIPREAEIMDQYKISNEEYDESVVTILKKKNRSKLIYHISPPENNLSEQENLLLKLGKNVLIQHQPKAEEMTDTERTRNTFFNIAKDLIRDLAGTKGMNVSYSSLNKLATILVRNTIGFGLIEVLLQDTNLQDISLNSPIPQVNIYVKHNKYDECSTNILPSQEDANSWAAKFRMMSGRPLDEANPILDTQLEIGNLRARISIVQNPLSPDGLAYSIRRHRENPWTLSLFIENNMINQLGAGLMSFLIDGSRTLLVAGTRSSGKTSFLGSLLLEIVPKYRIITVEDTLELPVESMRDLRFNILRLKVRSALMKGSNEVEAAEGIRSSLRLGDSCLIIGEVRSEEAKALYEAMRVGALANVVAGTIHGASPYGVFDRVVNDLGVPATSFKATDIIVVCNPVKSADGMQFWRRVVSISEIRKHWNKDPMSEGGFVDLMKYNVEKDKLEPTEELINGNSEIIKDIAGNVKGWAGNWDAVWDNIELRGKIKNKLVEKAKETGRDDIMESEFSVLANHAFHRISSEVIKEQGLPWSQYVYPKWEKWLEKEIEKRFKQ
ncbi:MAG TPA: type II/IV secretion system ATPase subunit [Candidatus Nanoarchaeia archaeon]|nr:type II/IV secretion system ATPase subunit [Candidatus Nanoarchaeia archaeon]